MRENGAGESKTDAIEVKEAVRRVAGESANHQPLRIEKLGSKGSVPL